MAFATRTLVDTGKTDGGGGRVVILLDLSDHDGNGTALDTKFATIEGINVRKKNDVITLDYAEVEYIKQQFATRSESVTPFLISFWQGTMELSPASDTWVDTTRLEAKVISMEGNYQYTFDQMANSGEINPQTGFGPIVWDQMIPLEYKKAETLENFKKDIKKWIPRNCHCRLCKEYIQRVGFVNLE